MKRKGKERSEAITTCSLTFPSFCVDYHKNGISFSIRRSNSNRKLKVTKFTFSQFKTRTIVIVQLIDKKRLEEDSPDYDISI